ncbi:MAG: hypothetical protein KDJ22_13605 [Candidatus Competibacteraceae bacterium]|nr:hypothetical protein [Candidatus Competibacteraceae bacterium]MCP5124117.1 hypothetical protein [Gammaproteobacteria bacterium]HRX70439.1 hypothetical protein [Candidatus Competibacteraceae bacterium]
MAQLTIQHLGRLTRIIAHGGDAQFKKLRNALLLKNFVVAAEHENRLELRRRAYLLQDDWPIQVSIRRNGSEFEIDYYLSIPWGWIAGLTFLTWVALPFAGFQNAGLAFVLALLVAALAIYKQKFDCRPDAGFWQQRPRQHWGEMMERLVREAFDRS